MSRKKPAPAPPDDRFDEPYDRTTSAIAVLHALAAAHSTNDDTREWHMWWGIRDLTERALEDLSTMDSEYAKASNYIFDLVNGRPPGKGAGPTERRKTANDGAR